MMKARLALRIRCLRESISAFIVLTASSDLAWLASLADPGVEHAAPLSTHASAAPRAVAEAAAPSPMPYLQPNYMEFAPRITVVGCGGAGGNAGK